MMREQITAIFESGVIQPILEGLWVTVRISVLSLFLGTLLAAPLCAARISARKHLSYAARAVIAILRGTPVLLLLMVFYYVVFAGTRIDASLIAVIAFTLHVAASVSEIFRSALSAVPKGQLDAAFALGMSKAQIFRDVTLPQASRIALPVYRGAVVNLIQWTSVVGYISITDLTRAINFVSARTMRPLLLLFVGIALYWLLAGVAFVCFPSREGRRRGRRAAGGGSWRNPLMARYARIRAAKGRKADG